MITDLERPARVAAPGNTIFPEDAVAVDLETMPRPTVGPAPVYAFCTLVTRPEQYASLVHALRARGFDQASTEFLFVNNSDGNQLDAYRGLSLMIRHAHARYCVLCHQDITLLEHGRPRLDAVIAELEMRDPHWALAGNAGATSLMQLRLRISDPHGNDVHRGKLPARVASLDENFIVLRREAGIECSPELSGFHLYGIDLCLRARARARTAYVVDFHLHHFGGGVVDAEFDRCRDAIERLYTAQGLVGVRRTTCTLLIFGLPRMVQRSAGALIHRVVIAFVGRLESWGIV